MLHTEFYRGLEAAEAALAMRPDAPPGARAAAVHAAIAPLLSPGPDTAPRACARGCDACCHFPVGVTHAEAERLAD
ncbi:MAG: hypothetical protein KDE27_13640, partial [Planctomycetes bacterium]|nr:hypothetical protein [Planctomycetota bacterium]